MKNLNTKILNQVYAIITSQVLLCQHFSLTNHIHKLSSIPRSITISQIESSQLQQDYYLLALPPGYKYPFDILTIVYQLYSNLRL